MQKTGQMLDDPAIKEAAEQIAADPAFKQMQENMASQVAKMQESGGALGGPGPSSAAELQQMMLRGGVPGGGMMGAGVDPQQAMQAMEGVMKNPAFAQMAQKLGEQMMQDPTMKTMMSEMNNPETTRKMKEKMDTLKEDPEMGPILKYIEQGGPQAMMKYWNDPGTLKKINEAMAEVMPGMSGIMPPGFNGAGADVAEQMKNLKVDNEEEDEEEEDE